MSSHFPFSQFLKFTQETKETEKENSKNVKNFSPSYIDENFSKEEISELTQEIKRQLQANISEEKYRMYFHDTFFISQISQDSIVCVVTTNFLKRTLENHYLLYIQESVQKTLGKSYEIKIETTQDIPEKNIGEAVKLPPIPQPFRATEENKKHEIQSKVIEHFQENKNFLTGISKDKTFENFISGPSNKMAYSAAIAISKKPGAVYPALYIHGNSGLGKTHLLHAVGNKILEKDPTKKITLISASAFMQEMISHIQNDSFSYWFKRYSQDLDVLMIDDIQGLKNKEGTQDRFFEIFNELHKNKKQLLFTSDKHPNKIDGISERIRTRLQGALVVEVQQPEFETRMAILKQKAQDQDINLSHEVATVIASSIKSNIRELEGSLIALGAYSSLNETTIDIELAREILGLDENCKKELTYESILETVSEFYQIPKRDILGKIRIKKIAHARHIAMYFCYHYMKATLKETGEYFGGRDHSTVLHAVKKIQEILKQNGEKASDIYQIEARLS